MVLCDAAQPVPRSHMPQKPRYWFYEFLPSPIGACEGERVNPSMHSGRSLVSPMPTSFRSHSPWSVGRDRQIHADEGTHRVGREPFAHRLTQVLSPQ